MDTIVILKALIEDEHIEIPSDIILNLYIEDAKNSIKKYSMLSNDDYNNTHLEIQTAQLAKIRYMNKKYLGIKNVSEGTKSKSFELDDIPNVIKSSLPKPPVFSA